MSSAPKDKDTIYIDVNDEITGIIDKLRGSDHKIVALVLPKRATVLQSIVNMKLLKRSAGSAKKQLVLITSEAGLLPLAGAVGLHVAKSLQSKPEIPDAPENPGQLSGKPEAEDAVELADEDPAVDGSKSVGELAGEEETIELDDDAESDDPDANADDKPKSRLKGLKIPNFNKFRLLIIAGSVGVVFLITFGVLAFMVWPKAQIVIKTNSTTVTSMLDLTLKTAPEAVLDAATATLPAVVQQTKKTVSQQVAATGQLDKGAKASGKVTVKNCGADEVTIPSGTAVSANGLTFITQSRLDLDDGKFGGICKPSGEHIATVDVVAQLGGEQYNLEPRSDYKVAGQSSSVTANGTAMTGGTTSIIKVVAQADIDSAKQKIATQDSALVKDELKNALIGQHLYAIEATYTTSAPDTKQSASVGTEAENVTVTQEVTYSMLGVTQENLEKIIAHDVNKQIDASKQKVSDYGLTEAGFNLQNQKPDGMVVSIEAIVTAGPELKLDDIKKQVAGKKANAAKELIKDHPGVTDVSVKYSPFWVSAIPSKPSKIFITVDKPQDKTSDAADSDQ